ncbi:glycerol-3-phosphate dehydrogenase/oxidase [Nakamurella flavida]|uniref:glycerol-3-phosphate dehydrogenase n=1 Tax=Nakamurella flavida TaxID=363630 RepID=A0A939C282_9ACTN|nr:glycerol-3-phosphate dehydrogenase/oxidase [Nakamurella flavida]MBM9478468.1 glycerol-3-phosphate dehydrogenase/oxidase [Nakamurella flavida]MDP9777706.1 glycerol-3-phosphate dehydrogenase [Nakamurella flavida]
MNGETVAGRLGPAERAENFRRLAEETFDVVVIGAGVVGAGAALDAATRGLSVAMIEARDISSGTSSRSSKLFHGGLRYLEMFEFGLVREALRERELMLTKLCPHLAKPVSFLYPLSKSVVERPYVGAGLMMYDTMGGARSVPRHKHLTRAGALRLVPGLRRDALVGGIRYYDGQVDDARHTLAVARTAAAYGAVVQSSAQVVSFIKEADRVAGVRIRDVENADGGPAATIDVKARVVINAAGVWTDELQRLSGGRGRFKVRASKGVHLVVARDKITSESGIILKTEKSVLFVIPWKAHWIIGTTDTDWNLDLAHPAATRKDIDYILGHVNSVLAVPLTHDDIEGVYAGLRPLLAGESEQSSKLSREHAVARVAPGLVSIAGGKYTTYRVMGADAVDAAAEDLPGRIAPSCTENVPLVGAEGYQALVNQADRIGARYGVHPYRVRHLLDRYGSELFAVLDLALDPEHADPQLLTAIPGAPEYLQVEILYATLVEGALHVEDVLARRTRISIEYAHRGTESVERVADLMGGVLGWSAEQRAHEVASYVARVEAERLSQTEPDDQAADQARLEAPEVRGRLVSPVA